MRTTRPVEKTDASNLTAIVDGFRFVRQNVWLWGTLASAAIAYLAFLGPTEVLLPYLVKNELHGSAGDLGLVFAAGGVGAVGAAVLMAQRGHPKRDVTTMYACWTIATLAVAGYGLARSTTQLMLACLVFNALEAAGTIIWATIKQLHVPASLLGRVSSLDWLISIGFLPISFALTAPAADLIGVRNTLVVACHRRERRDARRLVHPRHAGDRGHRADRHAVRAERRSADGCRSGCELASSDCADDACLSSPLTGRAPIAVRSASSLLRRCPAAEKPRAAGLFVENC